jgi:hypothetical protein
LEFIHGIAKVFRGAEFVDDFAYVAVAGEGRDF